MGGAGGADCGGGERRTCYKGRGTTVLVEGWTDRAQDGSTPQGYTTSGHPSPIP